MKKILVPTDFSSVSDNALQHAIEIAAEFNSELYLCHVFHISKVDYNINFSKEDQPFAKQAKRYINQQKLRFSKTIAQKGLILHTIVEQNDFISLFRRKTTELGVDLIVMGSKRDTGLSKVIFGSVAMKAIEWANVPVMIVTPEHSFRPPEHIVLAIDEKEIAPAMLFPIQELASRFNARVTILNVNPTLKKDTERAEHMIGKHLQSIETTYLEVPQSSSINETISRFIKKGDSDLLCMIRRERSWWERFLKTSITKAQTYQSEVPLLILTENQ